MNIRSVVSNLLLKKRRGNAYRTVIGLLNILEEFPDERGGKLWHKVVKTIMEIVHEYPEEIFTVNTTSSSNVPCGAEKRPCGFLCKMAATDGFTEKIAFIGFIGNEKDGRYEIQLCRHCDTDRPKPIHVFSFEVLQKKGSLCKTIAVFQNKGELSEETQHTKSLGADMVLYGSDAEALVITFINLTGVFA